MSLLNPPHTIAQQRPPADGFGYANTSFRVEHRPVYGPHTQAELLITLDALAESGVKAWWYAAAAKGSYPMFPSKHLPYRDDAIDYYPWLTEQAHDRGIAIFSWEYLSTAPLLAAQHPEWCWRFFEWDGPQIERDRHYVCWNSPYGQMLKHYCVEVVDDLGFDGIWFDGSFMQGHHASGTFACCCQFCADKYRQQTDRELPEKIDLRDPDVRHYMEWRNQDHMAYWRSLSGHVRQQVPQAIIVFNFFNRIDCNIESACPLRRLADDAPQWPDDQSHGPMEGMISTEIGFYPQQTMLMAKILRAINDNYPVELWGYAQDSPTLSCQTPYPNPTPALLQAKICASTGGYASFGLGRESLDDYRAFLQALSHELEPLGPYIGGTPDATIGMLASGCTKDFGYVDDDAPLGRPEAGWATAHGMHQLLNALHLPTEILLDNMLSTKFLQRHQAVVLPEAICLPDTASMELQNYVEQGGTLLLIGDTGTRTETGDIRQAGLLDDLFGVTWRDNTSTLPTTTFSQQLRGHMNHVTGRITGGLPPQYTLPGLTRLVQASSEVLATACYNASPTRRYTPQGIVQPEEHIVAGASVLRAKIGQGQAYWVVPNIAASEATYGPNIYCRQLVDMLLSDIERPFTTDAPANVVINLFHHEDRKILHLVNIPPTFLTLGIGKTGLRTPIGQLSHDVYPTGPITLRVSGKSYKVSSPTHHSHLTISHDSHATVIRLDQLEQHAVLVLEPDTLN